MADYTPNSTDAQQDAFVVRTYTDPLSYGSYDQRRWDAKYGIVTVVNEILGLLKGRVANESYGQTFACDAGLANGDPLYCDSSNHVAKGDSTSSARCRIIGFCRYKPSPTTCMVSHYRYGSSLSGGVAGAPCYLTDAGGYGPSAGSVAKKLGTYVSSTEALMEAGPATAQM